MSLEDKVREVNEIFGENWFELSVAKNSEIAKLPLEQQLLWVRQNSVHGQTYFFRDPILIPILKQLVLPSIKSKPIKIASVGCSDGREVYSVLMSFWNKMDQIVLHGYDVNPDFIKEAQGGGANIKLNSKGIRETSVYSAQFYEINNRWKDFGACREAYVLKPRTPDDRNWADLTFTKKARKKVKFDVHDIVKNPLPESYDAIMLLNVLCHYSVKGRERILKNITASLQPNGWLVCERYGPASASGKKEYDDYMQDLSRFGFIKQQTIIPTWYSKTDDVSTWSRVYRKH